jgi:hypothetical protein
MQRASRRRWERRSTSAIPTIHGSGAPTRTPMAFSGTGSRRARASTMSATARCRRYAIHSAGDHASVSSGSAPGRSTTTSRCTCSEDSPTKMSLSFKKQDAFLPVSAETLTRGLKHARGMSLGYSRRPLRRSARACIRLHSKTAAFLHNARCPDTIKDDTGPADST